MSWQERFWRFVPPHARDREDGCWEWLGSCDKHGYGRLQRGGRGEGQIKAHRASWLIHNPDRRIPPGKVVLHTCRNRWCVNPEHLELGTMSDAIWQSPKSWGYGRELANLNAKLSDAQVGLIRRFAERGVRQVEIAKAFGVASSTVSNIVTGRRRNRAYLEDVAA